VLMMMRRIVEESSTIRIFKGAPFGSICYFSSAGAEASMNFMSAAWSSG
jgi:hypothetical protein